jgi:sterol desaturase/sphingolipid hydroxylase (fatty acid hydroxylase superfamily)
VPLSELTKKEHRWPKLLYFCFWFENLRETLEILLGETLPAMLIYYMDPECGLPLLVFHYIYEIIATDALLEHNPDIDQEEIVSTLAVGQFHLEHHRNPGVNFGFTITLWDHVFGTFKKPKA